MTKAFRTALVYSITIVAMLTTINLLTSPGFLWFFFPAFGIAWWPVSVYFAGRKRPLTYAICGTALISALIVAIYLVGSPGAHPWFLYPILGVIWWPLGVFFAGKKKPLAFALFGTALICALFVALYLLTGPGTHPWYIYPVLGVIWWPLSVWGAKKGARAFSVAGGLYTILMLLTINLVASPAFWWWVYPAFFVLWWPMSVLLGEKAKTMAYAVGSAVAAFAFLVVMHHIHTPNELPWYLYALLPLAWWPVSKALSPRVGQVRFLFIGLIVFAVYYTGLSALLHGVSSLLSVFILLAGAWLLYAMGISKHRNSFPFALINAVLIAGYFYAVYRLLTPDAHPWFWYTFFPLAWWPIAAALRESAVKPFPVAMGAAAFLVYYSALNILISPAMPWVLFLAYPAVSAVLGSLCYQNRGYLQFSVWMTVAGIAYFTAINLVFTPHTVWAVYPAFGLLWWPMSLWLYGRRSKAGEEAE